jgi:Helix-turn-helix domain
MEVICIENEAFYTLLETIILRIEENKRITEDKWISGPEAMQKLRINSKTTLQKLRDEGKIRFSQPEKKLILYDSQSIDQFLDKHSKNTF